jgi:predicted nucleotidyltransferase component of viral defense system
MLDKSQHRQIMFNILQDIYQDRCASWLGFKGGTMLYFFEHLDRFSVDLDFDLLQSDKISAVRQCLHQIVAQYGQIIEERDKRWTLIFVLRYERGQHGLKLEVSKRQIKATEYVWRNFYGTQVQVMKLADSLAHKVAVTERKRIANRDFYDLWFLLKQGVRANEAVIQERTNKTLSQHLQLLLTHVEQELQEKQVMMGVGKLLTRSRRDWVKAKLKAELLGQLQFYLEQVSGA